MWTYNGPTHLKQHKCGPKLVSITINCPKWVNFGLNHGWSLKFHDDQDDSITIWWLGHQRHTKLSNGDQNKFSCLLLIRPNPIATKPILVTILNLEATPRQSKSSLVGIEQSESVCITIMQPKSPWFIKHLGCSMVIEIDFGCHFFGYNEFENKIWNFLLWHVWLGLPFNNWWDTFGKKCSFL